MGADILNKGISGALTGLVAGGIYGWASGSGFWDGAVHGAMYAGLGFAGWQTDRSIASGLAAELSSGTGREAAEGVLNKYAEQMADPKTFVQKNIEKGGLLGGLSDKAKIAISKEMEKPDSEAVKDIVKGLAGAKEQLTMDNLAKGVGGVSGVGSLLHLMNTGVASTPEGMAGALATRFARGALNPTASRVKGIWDEVLAQQAKAAKDVTKEAAQKTAANANAQVEGPLSPPPNGTTPPPPPPDGQGVPKLDE